MAALGGDLIRAGRAAGIAGHADQIESAATEKLVADIEPESLVDDFGGMRLGGELGQHLQAELGNFTADSVIRAVKEKLKGLISKFPQRASYNLLVIIVPSLKLFQ